MARCDDREYRGIFEGRSNVANGGIDRPSDEVRLSPRAAKPLLKAQSVCNSRGYRCQKGDEKDWR